MKIVIKNWPKTAATLTTVALFVQKNPAVATWLRGLVEDIEKRVADVQKKSGDAPKIRGMLGIIRDVAHEWEAHEGEQPKTDAATWIRRADDIELGVRLAEAQPRPEQKKTLAGLRTDTDNLLAALLKAIARARSLSSTDSGMDEPQAP